MSTMQCVFSFLAMEVLRGDLAPWYLSPASEKGFWMPSSACLLGPHSDVAHVARHLSDMIPELGV